MTTTKSTRATLLLGLGLLALPAAQAAVDVTYKCPGHVYSNTMSPKEAKDKA